LEDSKKKDKILSPKDKQIVAHHEAGHAVAGWFLEHSNPLLKVSIIPRGSAALGYAQYQPKEQHLYTKSELMDQLCVLLAGRIAEDICFGSISTGAQNDLERVTEIAYKMILRLGMNPLIGHVSYSPPKSDFPEERVFSQKTATVIDVEVRKLIKTAEERTRELLRKHYDGLTAVAQKLLEKEKIVKEDLVEILGDRPFLELRTFKEIIEEKKRVKLNLKNPKLYSI